MAKPILIAEITKDNYTPEIGDKLKKELIEKTLNEYHVIVMPQSDLKLKVLSNEPGK